MGLTCLVTIHGIGFQQPPDAAGTPGTGYADDLHDNLAGVLGEKLGTDPNRTRGGVYVASQWPRQGVPSREEGLKRLGSWDPANPGQLLPDPPALVGADGRATVAHVALVYSNLEDLGPQPAASLEAATQALLHATHYEPALSLVHSLFMDVKALFRHPKPDQAAPISLRPRTDRAAAKAAPAPGSPPPPATDAHPSGIIGTLRQLEDDVAGYVSRNALRESVRDFVGEALLRIAARRDVAAIVVNGHSQGTVVSYDALRDVPGDVDRDDTSGAALAWTFITAGSPLRKYRDLFSWGDEVGELVGIPWINFYDDSDPVADPLALRNPAELGTAKTLFRAVDRESGKPSDVVVDDHRVDNLAHCAHPGGLQAHNYWDNLNDFIGPLATILAAPG
jgi:hypothetical protein